MRRDLFRMPTGIYMDGNSLGPLPLASERAVARVMREWQQEAVAGWDGWFGLAERLSPTVAKLVGARPEEVIATGSITANLHALLASFYRPSGARRHIVATALDFPTDLYALQAWAERYGAELRLVESRDGHTLLEDDLEAALTDDVALAWFPTVLYRSGQLLDVARLSRTAHARGVLIGFDAAHSAGALPHAFHDTGVDFAVWCHYKYVNAGPGAPGGLFVHERHFDAAPGLPGWWGNDKSNQFEMRPHYRRARGAAAFQQGTPPLLALAALEGALEVFGTVDLEAVRARSLALTDLLIAEADAHLPELHVVTPREHARRGGHVALAHPDARLLSLALRERGIVPDFREPDILRLAPVALYTTEDEVREVVSVLRDLLDRGSYRDLEGRQVDVT
ncbi:kynureninase [Deinobacterium chartae]|uniref:Kynureninase n=1 Tax=Deinobacterium chartae TaxID=521158 RepID=A0A841I1Y5_9DEIO|nr:kynureninase [Deinobacterium chartae]MBB6099273.1 kynureninase [Deinobacterium chartae]